MLGGHTPSRAIRLLRQTGILATTLPELDSLPPAALERALEALDAVALLQPGHERLALAALFGTIPPAALSPLLARLRIGRHDIDAVVALAAAAAYAYAPTWGDAAVRRYMGRVPAELLDDLLVLRTARAGGEAEAQLERQLQERIAGQRAAASPLRLSDLALDGRDLQVTLGISEGPAIGIILGRLLDDVIEEPALNTHATLLRRAGLLLDELAPADRGADDDALHPPIR